MKTKKKPNKFLTNPFALRWKEELTKRNAKRKEKSKTS